MTLAYFVDFTENYGRAYYADVGMPIAAIKEALVLVSFLNRGRMRSGGQRECDYFTLPHIVRLSWDREVKLDKVQMILEPDCLRSHWSPADYGSDACYSYGGESGNEEDDLEESA